jgi:hypothetical protein
MLTIRQPLFAQKNGKPLYKQGTVVAIVADFYVADSWSLIIWGSSKHDDEVDPETTYTSHEDNISLIKTEFLVVKECPACVYAPNCRNRMLRCNKYPGDGDMMY